MHMPSLGLPDAHGLYDPEHEHDSCGVGFVVHIKGQRSNHIVKQALRVLINLLHRGASGCKENTGDGAGILIQMPDRFLRKEADRLGMRLPAAGKYGVGLVFLPPNSEQRLEIQWLLERIVAEEGQHVIGWRTVPTDDSTVGPSARAVAPVFRQLFVGLGWATSPEAFERKLYVIRKRIEHVVDKLDFPE